MNTVTIYLAGPIDGLTREQARHWRAKMSEHSPTGVLFFDPASAWHGASQANARALDFGNRVAICHSDGLLADLSGPGRGFGTIREIEFARGQGKPVAVATGDKDIGASLMTHDLMLAATAMEALDLLLAKIADGREEDQHPLLRIFGLRPPDEEEE